MPSDLPTSGPAPEHENPDQRPKHDDTIPVEDEGDTDDWRSYEVEVLVFRRSRRYSSELEQDVRVLRFRVVLTVCQLQPWGTLHFSCLCAGHVRAEDRFRRH